VRLLLALLLLLPGLEEPTWASLGAPSPAALPRGRSGLPVTAT
jgi:hypothetical protein